jgi:acetylglutamate kinase
VLFRSITAKLEELGIPSEFRNGFRYTDSQTMTVVRDVLRNQVSRELSELIEAAGAETIVLSGEDDNLFRAEKVTLQSESGEIDLGLVGEVRSVNPRSILAALEQGKVPVISTVAPTVLGELLNVNADLAAASLAVALGAEKLLVLTDVAGLYADWPNQDSLVSEISAAELRDLIPSLESGMIPKMQACLAAIDGGVPKAHIIDGRQPHSILLEIFTQAGVGTQVTR